MAAIVARATQRDAALETLVVLGFVYPDALDIRTHLPRDRSHVPVRGAASQTGSALPGATPDPGPASEPAAPDPQPQPPGAV